MILFTLANQCTFIGKDTVLFLSFQQLPPLGLGPLKGYLTLTQRPSMALIFASYVASGTTDIRGRHRLPFSLEKNRIELVTRPVPLQAP